MECSVGLGNYLPLEIAQHVLPKLPRQFQRFAAASSWVDAEKQSIGYSSIGIGALKSANTPKSPFTGNETALIAAIGVALSARASSSEPVKVLDFGGYDGKHAELIKQSFSEVIFDWVVVDVPIVVEAMANRNRSGLTFNSDLDAALSGQVDVVIASASLNYVPHPQDTLRKLCQKNSFVVITRMPLWPIQEHQPAVQRAQRWPLVEKSYPTWFFSERQFMAEIPKDAKILFDFICPDDRASFAGHYSTYRGLVLAMEKFMDRQQS
jgi:putative methyltransferase (TIGR04325 family)